MRDYPVKKNEEQIVTIQDLSHEGMGIAKVDGYLLFIENALPEEEVRIRIEKVGPKFGFAKVLEWLKESPYRVEDAKEELLRTGIAPLSHLSYPKQLEFKQHQVENVLRKVAKMPNVPVLPTVGMESPFHYRNKAQIPVQKIKGQLTTGFYRKHSHTLIPLEDFYIQDPAIDQAIREIRDILQRFGVKAYNEEAHEGFLRHIIIRRGHYSHQMMVILVTRKQKFFQAEKIAEAIKEKIPEVVSIIQNVNEEQTNVIMGSTNRVILGESFIEDQLLGKTYRISAQSFYQVNTEQTEKLYQIAMDFAQLNKNDIVVDAYSGIGTIGLSLAENVDHVYGMEIVAEAVKDAKKNAELNAIGNATYLEGKAEKIMHQWAREDVRPTVVFVDPPRKGLDASFIDATCEMEPERVVYISCNPATMARDVKLFAEKGYQLEKVQPVDLFPQTIHVETVCLMSRKEK
ncbi:23S rRNA (uracil(1939)-C(5))-methyltransferase RlmD [Enterococcus camelliae]|uniref:23S rRNA (Uracil(1939)-C(5))-methyltransferase RlmD n=1 Tax=Enterococcus camelliae TaxID=453959 RepID=A0ABW5TJ54_9ENTE